MPLTRLSPRRVARWALVLVALYGIGWLLWTASSALTPFIIGIVLAYLFLPLVNQLGKRMPRWAAILVVYVVALSLVVTFFAFLVPPLAAQIGQLVRAVPDINEIQNRSSDLAQRYEDLLASLPPEMAAEVRQGVDGMVQQAITTVRTNFASYLQDVGRFLLNSIISVVATVTFLLGFLLIPFWLFYVLMDQQAGTEVLNGMLPPRLRADFWAVATIIDRVFSGYLRGQLVLGLVVGSAAGIGLFVLDLFGLHVDYILLLAVIAGITELIPVIGPIVGAIPAVILGFIDSPTTGLAVLILYVAIQQLENHFLVPRITGDAVGLHAAILMLLLVISSQVFGVLGAILCAPLAAGARDVFIYLYGRLSDPPRPAGLLPEHLQPPTLAEAPTPEPVAEVLLPAVNPAQVEDDDRVTQ